MISVHVRYYSRLRELTFIEAESYTMDEGATLEDLLTRIITRHSNVLPFRDSLLLARNGEYASPSEQLADGDKVDLMPPVSGG